FTMVVPGLGGAILPWWILTRHGSIPIPAPAAWEAAPVVAAGAALYAWCVWNFAAVGRGTPGLWDAPRRVVAAGPYRWVRNPIYIAALLVVLGEACSCPPPLLEQGGGGGAFSPLSGPGEEHPPFPRRFGTAYLDYLRTVPRWIPHPPRHG